MAAKKSQSPKFSSNHYQKIAETLNTIYYRNIPYTAIIGTFADMFEKDNPGFIRQRFIDICYKEPRHG